ncbi:hypothetical protein AVEN_252751-1 [Araneus ventricosus]|uniref:Uncharacterized protein n=1 Tax=Araneus ventricosus TaxID=182803 RepID=A0A4Y2JW87_ARAVE|nr:hypothetical protein AVEN_252751-1 [Araneus ventricosus]
MLGNFFRNQQRSGDLPRLWTYSSPIPIENSYEPTEGAKKVKIPMALVLELRQRQNDLQWNRVSSLEPSGPEVEILPLGHRGLTTEPTSQLPTYHANKRHNPFSTNNINILTPDQGRSEGVSSGVSAHSPAFLEALHS